MKTTSSPLGRDVELAGYPIRMAELLSTLDGTGYIVRRSLHNQANIRKAKKALKTAFQVQAYELGFAMVELLSSCPTNWKLDPQEALGFVEEKMIPVFPPGDYKIKPEVINQKL
jgi:2-oxoglutarate ferredoxin oxidoreductase subunit beta